MTFLFWAIVFGVSYTQAPLYYSNQNQYFLHGLAQAGLGNLDQDWLANTKDPTPIFSAVVAFTYRYLHEAVFYLYYLLILGVYFHCLVGMFTLLTAGRASILRRLGFVSLFVGVHAGLVRLASARLIGVDFPWYWQAGLAGQYILGFGMQPSVCGVFLLASSYAFLRDQPWRAATWACLAAILHSTYLLSAAFLIASYMFLVFRASAGSATSAQRASIRSTLPRSRAVTAFLLGLWAMVLVSPVVIYNLLSFAPSSAAEFAEAQQILAHFRIPHHADPERWFDVIALCQVAWIVGALFVVRRSRLFVSMLVLFLGSLLLTLLQILTDNDTLALLFPWRTSAILVPLATTIILTRVINLLAPWLSRQAPDFRFKAVWACWAILGFFVAGGLAISIFDLGYRSNPDELPLLEFVQNHRHNGDLYLLPVEVPAPPRPKVIKAFSTNFTPAPRAGTSGHLIAIDLQRFRLVTGAPIFVDFKAIPYKDVEVQEWHKRIWWAKKMYAHRNWNNKDFQKELVERGITHVVTTADRPIQCTSLEKIWSDGNYRLFRVRKLSTKEQAAP